MPTTGASNGWAFGGDATASGHGIVVANPHFPWGGEARFWECHLTIPGELDVYGVSLLGTPGVQMGFNARRRLGPHVLAAGTASPSPASTWCPATPPRYRYGDDEREMTSHRPHAVEVLERRRHHRRPSTRTLWRSHHGPMVNLPLLGWGLELGFTYRDANLDNDHGHRAVPGAWTRPRSMDEFQAVLRPASRACPGSTRSPPTAPVGPGTSTPRPRRTSRPRRRAALPRPGRATTSIAALLFENRVALLDGSDPGDEWLDDPGARSPGLVPYDRLPAVRAPRLRW